MEQPYSKALCHQAKQPELILGTHMVEGEDHFCKWSSDLHVCHIVFLYVMCTHTHTKYNLNILKLIWVVALYTYYIRLLALMGPFLGFAEAGHGIQQPKMFTGHMSSLRPGQTPAPFTSHRTHGSSINVDSIPISR